MSAFLEAARPGDRHELLPDGRPGADDEDPRSNLASFGEKD
jgi:hypothetical protein